VKELRVSLDELGREFGPEELSGHFVFGRSLPVSPEGWGIRRKDGWLLASAPDLPVIDVVDPSGQALGWIVGHPVDIESRCIVSGESRSPVGVGEANFDERFEDWLYGFGGRLVAIVLGPSPRVLPDACATFAVLYSPELEAVASSVSLLPNREGLLPASDYVTIFEVERSQRDFYFGTTPVEHVRQLYANHALDLRTWQVERRWPRGPLDEGDVTSLGATVAEVGEAIVVAAANVGGARMGLTAGVDTRVMLACGRPVKDEIDFFTLAFEDGLGSTDLRWAPVIAERYGLRHRVVRWQPATEADVRLWLYRTGCMSGEPRGRYSGPTFRAIGGTGPFLAGTNGAMMRGEYWARWYRSPKALQPDQLVGHVFHCPLDPRFITFTEGWLEGLPPLSVANTLALWFQEMADGCWAASQTAAFPDVRPVNIYPLAHRTVVEASLRTPDRDRLADRLHHAAIEARWPELLEVPFNKASTTVVLHRTLTRAARKARAGTRKGVRYAKNIMPGNT
jgi:hypothetical protein